jgi:hypothetical protein
MQTFLLQEFVALRPNYFFYFALFIEPPRRQRDFSLLDRVQNVFGAQPVSYTMDTGATFSVDKVAGT